MTRNNVILFMDVLRPFSYLAGLFYRVTIKAIASSPFIPDAKGSHEMWEGRMGQIWN